MNMSTEDIHEVYQEEVERPGYVLEMTPRRSLITDKTPKARVKRDVLPLDPAPHKTVAEFDPERFVPLQN